MICYSFVYNSKITLPRKLVMPFNLTGTGSRQTWSDAVGTKWERCNWEGDSWLEVTQPTD